MRITRTGAKKEKESKLGLIVVIIVSLVGLLIIIISAHASFPVYLFYAAFIILLIAILCLLIYGVLAHPMNEFIKKRRESRKHNALARKYFDDFKHFTERFGEFVDSTRRDTIPGVINDLNGSQEFRNISFLSPQDLYNLFNYFKERLKRFDRTKEDFLLIVKEFDTILDMYNEFCVFKPVNEIRRIGRNKVKEGTKEKYKKYKGAYEQFIRNYMYFGKNLNGEFDEKIFKEYFEMPEEL